MQILHNLCRSCTTSHNGRCGARSSAVSRPWSVRDVYDCTRGFTSERENLGRFAPSAVLLLIMNETKRQHVTRTLVQQDFFQERKPRFAPSTVLLLIMKKTKRQHVTRYSRRYKTWYLTASTRILLYCSLYTQVYRYGIIEFRKKT